MLEHFFKWQRNRCFHLVGLKQAAMFFRQCRLENVRRNRYASARQLRLNQRERQRQPLFVRNSADISI